MKKQLTYILILCVLGTIACQKSVQQRAEAREIKNKIKLDSLEMGANDDLMEFHKKVQEIIDLKLKADKNYNLNKAKAIIIYDPKVVAYFDDNFEAETKEGRLHFLIRDKENEKENIIDQSFLSDSLDNSDITFTQTDAGEGISVYQEDKTLQIIKKKLDLEIKNLSIQNLSGKLMYRSEVKDWKKNKLSIPLDNYPADFYIVQIQLSDIPISKLVYIK